MCFFCLFVYCFGYFLDVFIKDLAAANRKHWTQEHRSNLSHLKMQMMNTFVLFK